MIDITFAFTSTLVKNNIDQFLNELDLIELTNNIKQQSNNVKQQFSQIVENLSTTFSFFTTKNFFFEIKTFDELSNIVENNAIFIFNFDFSNILNVVNNEI